MITNTNFFVVPVFYEPNQNSKLNLFSHDKVLVNDIVKIWYRIFI